MSLREFKWDGDAAKRLVREQAITVLTQICLLVVRRAKELLSHPGTGKVKGSKTGPVTHSPAGQPPYKQTGRGRASVTYEIDEQALSARVGTNVDYMKFQELGTKRGIKPRPWLRRAWDESWSQAQALMNALGISWK